jgi:hypothetical protein
MGLAVWNHLPVEVGHLLHQVMVLHQDRSVRPDGKRKLVAGHGISRIICSDFAIIVFHGNSSFILLFILGLPGFTLLRFFACDFSRNKQPHLFLSR